MTLGLNRLAPNRRGAGAGTAAADTAGTTYTVSGLKVGSTAILYGNGTQIATATVDGTGKATWTLGAKPAAGTIITYDGVVVGSGGTVPVPVSALGPTTASFTAGSTTPIPITGLNSGETVASVTGSFTVSGNSIVPSAGLAAGSYSPVVTTSTGRTLTIAVTANAAVALSMPASVASVAGFGDSITAGSFASTNALRWLDQTATALSAGTPLNAGIAGTVLQNTADATGNPKANNGRDRYVAALTEANKREMLFIAYGYNDARVTAPLFNTANFKNDYAEIINGLFGWGYTPDRICIVSPYYITDAGLAVIDGDAGGRTRAYHESFVTAAGEVAAQFGVYYANAYAFMRDNGGASLIGADNIHPNDAGHTAIKNCVLAAKRTPVNLNLPFAWSFAVDFEGADNSVGPVADTSPAARSMTFGGGAKLSTTAPLAGTSSILMTTSTDSAIVATSFDGINFDTQLFAIRFRMRPDALLGSGHILVQKWGSTSNRAWQVFMTAAGVLQFITYDSSGVLSTVATQTTGAIAANTTYDVVVDKGTDGYVRIYAAPVGANVLPMVGKSAAVVSSIRTTAAGLTLGSVFTGKFDTLRIRKGATPWGTDAGADLSLVA